LRLGFGCFIFSQCAVIATRIVGKKNKFSGLDALSEKFTFGVELTQLDRVHNRIKQKN
jgi:hypothetical protein